MPTAGSHIKLIKLEIGKWTYPKICGGEAGVVSGLAGKLRHHLETRGGGLPDLQLIGQHLANK